MTPIDRELLASSVVSEGQMNLPAEAYTDAAVLDWEKEHFFDGSWVCVGRSEDLRGVGDRCAVALGHESALLTRDEEGGLRAFYNVCRHRGHVLAEVGELSSGRFIRCPYHAWAYGLDGSLQGAPGFGQLPGFERADYSLVPVRVAEWEGWLFANASGDAPPFEEHVGYLGEMIGNHRCGEDHEARGAWIGGSMELEDHAETMSLTGESFAPMLPHLTALQEREVYYYQLFPNLLMSLHPDYVMTHRLRPIAPDRTAVECEWLFSKEALETEGFDPSYASEFWDITNGQDWGACEGVQRGASSRGYRQGPLSPDEATAREFVALIAGGYLEGGVTQIPDWIPPERNSEPLG